MFLTSNDDVGFLLPGNLYHVNVIGSYNLSTFYLLVILRYVSKTISIYYLPASSSNPCVFLTRPFVFDIGNRSKFTS